MSVSLVGCLVTVFRYFFPSFPVVPPKRTLDTPNPTAYIAADTPNCVANPWRKKGRESVP